VPKVGENTTDHLGAQALASSIALQQFGSLRRKIPGQAAE